MIALRLSRSSVSLLNSLGNRLFHYGDHVLNGEYKKLEYRIDIMSEQHGIPAGRPCNTANRGDSAKTSVLTLG